MTSPTIAGSNAAAAGNRFHVEVEHGEDLTVKGNIVDHDYTIERDGKKIAEVSRTAARTASLPAVLMASPC